MAYVHRSNLELLKEFNKKYGKTIREHAKYLKERQKEVIRENLEDLKADIKEDLENLKDNVHETLENTVQLITTPIISVVNRIMNGESCKNDYDVKRYAILSAHCYGTYNDSILPSNCVLDKRYDLKDSTEANVYRYHNEVICAFTGSEDGKDWINNGLQLIGLSPQYESALRIGKEVRSLYPYCRLTFVGHSKGGGQAAYCALCLGVGAVTFNPAGISIPTKFINGVLKNSEDQIHAYVFKTDILNSVQELFGSFGLQADGNIHYINDFEPNGESLIDDIHGIGGILRYFGV